MKLTLSFLAIIAALPRLLTLLRLWQLKEWRIDRLKEHLRSEGYVEQTWGILEPVIIGVLIFTHVYVATSVRWTVMLLAMLVLSHCIKAALGKQLQPEWTKKALAMLLICTVLTGIAAAYIVNNAAGYTTLFTLPLLEPLFVLLAWLILMPIDIAVKRRIINAAERTRASHKDLIVIGITGSAGKTTTKELLGQILIDMQPLVTPLHVNTEIGVSAWIQKTMPTRPDVKVLIVEMGAYRKGEIDLLCRIVKPTIGIITSIGTQHLALFGSQKAILEAKGELFAALPSSGHAFANADDPACSELLQRAKCHVTTIGTGKGADLLARDIVETPNGMHFIVENTDFEVPVFGTHNVTNALLAIGVGLKLGMTLGQCAMKLKQFRPPERTFTVRIERGVKILDDTYNASPESFKAAINWTKMQPQQEKVLIFSGIIELGKDEQKIHALLGEYARGIFTEIYVTNKNCIQSLSLGLGKNVHLIDKNTTKLKNGALLVCIGRMNRGNIAALLP